MESRKRTFPALKVVSLYNTNHLAAAKDGVHSMVLR